MLARGIEYDVLPTCLRYGIGVMTYSPLAGGWLSGRYRKGQQISRPTSPARQHFTDRDDTTSAAHAAKLDAADALGAAADEAGMTLIQMAIAFATRHPAVTSAIVGPRTIEHLESYLAADEIDLSDDLLDRIDETVHPRSPSTPPTTCGRAPLSAPPPAGADPDPARDPSARPPLDHHRP